MEGIHKAQTPTPPWRKKNPRKKHSKLSPQQREKARARAEKAGRPYPNLVDNMWAAQQPAQS